PSEDGDPPPRHRDREPVVRAGVPVPRSLRHRLLLGADPSAAGGSGGKSFVTLISIAYYHAGIMDEQPTAVAGRTEPAALAARLRVAGWRFARRMRQESDPGITPTLHAALHSIETHGPMTAGQLAAHEHVQKPTMTRTIQALVDRELVERLPDPLDRRISWLRSTPAGKTLR